MVLQSFVRCKRTKMIQYTYQDIFLSEREYGRAESVGLKNQNKTGSDDFSNKSILI